MPRNPKLWMLGAFWVALNIVVPQISLSSFEPIFNGKISIHPFFHWRLFSGGKSDQNRFILKIRQCEKYSSGDNVLEDKSLNDLSGKRWQTFCRLQYIGNLIKSGKKQLGHDCLMRLVQVNYPSLAKCDLTLYSYNLRTPRTFVPVEEIHGHN